MPVETHSEPMADRLLSPRELASLLSLGRTTTYNLLTTGEIPSVRIGKLHRVRPEDVQRFIEARLQGRDA